MKNEQMGNTDVRGSGRLEKCRQEAFTTTDTTNRSWVATNWRLTLFMGFQV